MQYSEEYIKLRNKKWTQDYIKTHETSDVMNNNNENNEKNKNNEEVNNNNEISNNK